MQLAERKKDVQQGGMEDLETQDFKIQTSSKAFEILSNGLYNNKVRAAVRELVCNAYDAHISANKKSVPYEVHLPNAMEPWFEVKDYGTGLKEEDVYELYTTYFSSDKTDSNLFVGALGLGSKSPFAVTDQFTVESRYEGTKSTYLCYISENSTPQVSKVVEQETEEENGLTVRFNVQEYKTREYAEELAKVLRPFDRLPIVKGNREIIENKLATYHSIAHTSGEGWYIIPRGYGRDDISIIQGNVEYPIDEDDLDYDFQNTEDDNLHNFLRDFSVGGAKLVVYFPIGTLNIAASREELSLDQRTKDNLKKRLRKVYQEYESVIQEKVSEIEDEFSLARYASNLPGVARRFIVNECIWNGKKVNDALSMELDPQKDWIYEIARYGVSSSRASKERIVNRFNINGRISRFVYYDYKDKVKKDMGKIKRIARINDEVIILFYNKSFLNYFVGDIQYENISELEDPRPPQSQRSGSSRSEGPKDYVSFFRVGRLSDKFEMTRDEFFEDLLGQTDKKVLYVMPNRQNHCNINGHKVEDDDVRRMLNEINRQYPSLFGKYFYPIVYKIKKWEANLKKFRENEQVVEITRLLDYLYEKDHHIIPKNMAVNQINNMLDSVKYNFRDDLTSLYNVYRDFDGDIQDYLNSNSDFYKAWKVIDRLESYIDKHRDGGDKKVYINALRTIGNYLNKRVLIHNKIKPDKLQSYVVDLLSAYPLLRRMRLTGADDTKHTLYYYINSVDKGGC